MKKIIKLALLALMSTCLFGCDLVNSENPSSNGGSSEQPSSSEVQSSEQAKTTWTVEFMLNNGTEDVYKTVEVEDNKKISTSITDPSRNGYTFDGWYVDSACTVYFDEAGDKVTSNMKVYAKWVSSGITNPDTPGEDTSSENGSSDIENSEDQVGELPGSTDAPTEGFALLFNGTNYVSLVSLGDEKDYQGRDQYAAKGVAISEGQVFKCYNSAGGAIWVEKVLEPYGVCDPAGAVAFEATDDGIKCLISGTYDIYVKMKWEDNTIYIGPAA